ncbi:hypothetical protein ALC57_17366 [Trachymyrmex cornetzi]|uniref:Uncharacterized protein n=1 Tax=Trachymyrmex cornetzi TaxID=471704 RepID=A0A195DEA6_9HYME|nr:hypothetical protein ALC57_17366 [Trachymyrmex cornetzi]
MNSRGILGYYDGIYVNIVHRSKELKETINEITDEVVYSVCILEQLIKFDSYSHTERNAKCGDVKGQRLTLPSSSSCGVSTPWSGTRSPVKLLVCVNGRFTPLMCDIAAGPLCARSFFFAARASALPAAATASSIRKDGKSSSCCLSVGQQKVTWINVLGDLLIGIE